MMTTSDTTAQPTGLSPNFVFIVGILLLVIIAALTGLALSYRARALVAEAEAAHLREVVQTSQGAMQLLADNLAPPLERDRLAALDATLDGRAVKVFIVDADRARSLGLVPGDILRVGQAAPPASAPAEP